MKLFMIIYAGARIGGFAGPLPYDEAECHARAAEANDQIQAQIATGHDKEGGPITPLARSIRFACEWRDEKPITEPPADGSVH